MKEIVAYLMSAPDSQFDKSMTAKVAAWSDPPTAIEVLEVLDACINGSLASGFDVTVLQALYDMQCKAEVITHDECVLKATWRNDPDE